MYSAFSGATDDDSTTPALRFERLFGLRDIGRRWAMPGCLSLRDMERQLKCDVLIADDDDYATQAEACARGNVNQVQKFRRGIRYTSVIKDLNPHLRPVQVNGDNWKHIVGFLHGAASGFHEDDIDAWIHGRADPYAANSLRKRIANEFYRPPQNSWYPQSLRSEFAARANVPKLLLSQIRWIPCTKTIQRINEQLDLKRVP